MESTIQLQKDGFTKDNTSLFIQRNMRQRSTKRLTLPPYLHCMPTLPKISTPSTLPLIFRQDCLTLSKTNTNSYMCCCFPVTVTGALSSHRRAFTWANNDATSLFSDWYLTGFDECLGKKSIVGKLPNFSSRCAYSLCSPSALNLPTFTPAPARFSANSTYDPSIAWEKSGKESSLVSE